MNSVLERVKAGYEKTFGSAEKLRFFSAPGRTELSGNHTDHQHGKVLAAAINLDTVAAVSRNADRMIRIQSEGYPFFELSLDDLGVHSEEIGTTAALVRGVAARIASMGNRLCGFNAYCISCVLPGSGLSSSAAFEVLVGTILNGLCSCGLDAVEIAKIGQYAENIYFGKPCGLMDQMASSVGNVVAIDFESTETPVVTPIKVDISQFGYALVIIDSGADHADLTDEYAAIPGELKTLCRAFGKAYLREIPEEAFYAHISEARKAAGDRAVLRAIHEYEENKRVDRQVAALQQGDFDTYLRLMIESGRSSWMLLQNVIPSGAKAHQELALGIALAEKLLGGRGGYRVHGGGFAGTLQTFVPNDMLDSFVKEMDRYLGEGSCHILSIRAEGGCEIKE